MRVLVTGAAGYFGRQIVPALLEDPRVTEVVALDRVPFPTPHPRLNGAVRDLAAGEGGELLAGMDAAIHLAFHVDRRPGQDVSPLNEHGTRAFLARALEAVDTLVVASSIAAYGLRTEPFESLSEADAPASGRGFYYAEQKMAMERFLAEHPGRARVVVARPCSVAGPGVDARRALQYKDRLLVLPRVAHAMRLQVLHEADLGSAFAALLEAPAGIYNVAPDDWLAMPEAARITGQRLVVAPRWVCHALCDLTWRWGVNALDPEWLRMHDYPTLVASNAKLRALGWRPAKSTADALAETVAAIRGGLKEAIA